jgi:MinD-like ATPase involved in chromosome partitioning or flagellar assembly
MAEVVAIASAKGGVGKTTIAANVGAALAIGFNKNVLLIDGNITGANLAYHFGINYPRKTIADFDGRLSVEDLVYFHSSGVKLIPGPIDLDSRIQSHQIENIVNALRNDFDVVLIDLAPSLGRETLTILKASDKILPISTNDIPGFAGCMKIIDLSQKLRKKTFGIILNRIAHKSYELTKDEIASMCGGHEILSYIAESVEIPKSIALQQPLVLSKPNHPISIEFKKIAAHVIDSHYEPTGFWYRLKELFRLVRPEKEVGARKGLEKAKIVEHVMKEVLDMEKLKSELTEEIREELKRGIKEDLKQEIVEKLKQKLKERELE